MIYYACLKEAYNFLIYATPPKTTICVSTFYYNTISIVITASHFYSPLYELVHEDTSQGGGFYLSFCFKYLAGTLSVSQTPLSEM